MEEHSQKPEATIPVWTKDLDKPEGERALSYSLEDEAAKLWDSIMGFLDRSIRDFVGKKQALMEKHGFYFKHFEITELTEMVLDLTYIFCGGDFLHKNVVIFRLLNLFGERFAPQIKDDRIPGTGNEFVTRICIRLPLVKIGNRIKAIPEQKEFPTETIVLLQNVLDKERVG